MISRLINSVLLLLVCVGFASADFVFYAKPNGGTEIKPQAIPTSLTTVVTGDVHLSNLCIIVASGAPTVTVQDMQGTPIPILPGITTANGTFYYLPPGMLYWAVGGFKIQASGVGAYIYASW